MQPIPSHSEELAEAGLVDITENSHLIRSLTRRRFWKETFWSIFGFGIPRGMTINWCFSDQVTNMIILDLFWQHWAWRSLEGAPKKKNLHNYIRFCIVFQLNYPIILHNFFLSFSFSALVCCLTLWVFFFVKKKEWLYNLSRL